MKKVLKYINNNIIELVAIRDTAILVVMFYVAWLAVKFAILYLA
tara:strand:- start:421 stop:552 length:132 start_codon:yes stop_codon:yes gene_type:complete